PAPQDLAVNYSGTPAAAWSFTNTPSVGFMTYGTYYKVEATAQDQAGNVSSVASSQFLYALPNTGVLVSTGVGDIGTGAGGQRRMVRASDNALYMVYLKKWNANVVGQKRLFLARSSDNGLTWADTTAAPIETVGDSGGYYGQEMPALAIDSDDVLHVVWGGVSSLLDAGGVEPKIVYSSASIPGTSWSSSVSTIPVHPYMGIEVTPALAVDSQNGLHVVWAGQDDGLENGRISYSSRAVGGDWTPYVDVFYEGVDMVEPALAIDGQDRLHVVARKRRGKNTGAYEQIVYSSRAANGMWGQWQDIANTPGYLQGSWYDPRSNGPALAVDPSGGLHAVWSGLDAAYSPYSQVMYSSRAAAGAAWMNPENVAPQAGLAMISPSVAVDNSGAVYVAAASSNTPGNIRLNSKLPFSVWGAWSDVSNGSDEQALPSLRWSGWWNNGGKLDYTWLDNVDGTNYSLRADKNDSVIMPLGFTAGDTTRIWIGNVNATASIAGNWSNGQVPVNGDYVVFGDTNPGNACNWNLNITVASMTFTSLHTGTVDFVSPLTVNGPFVVNGGQARFGFNPGIVHTFNDYVDVNGFGVFSVAGGSVAVAGPLNVNPSSYLNIQNGALFRGSTVTVYNGGHFDMSDSGGGPPLVTSLSPATRLRIILNGTVAISSGAFGRLASEGLRIGNSAAIVDLSSVSFNGPLLAGATAINFTDAGGVFTSTFTNIGFNDPNIAVNVNARELSATARITVRYPQGARAGPPYEDDPMNVVWWPEAGGSGGVDEGFEAAASTAIVSVLPWATNAANGWSVDTATCSSGARSVRAGSIANSQVSWLETS
ncbi:MAG: hypothetical protein WC881_11395, partial [Elusimicrobiota bacterium]